MDISEQALRNVAHHIGKMYFDSGHRGMERMAARNRQLLADMLHISEIVWTEGLRELTQEEKEAAKTLLDRYSHFPE